jgi:hypothetical protein
MCFSPALAFGSAPPSARLASTLFRPKLLGIAHLGRIPLVVRRTASGSRHITDREA